MVRRNAKRFYESLSSSKNSSLRVFGVEGYGVCWSEVE